MSLQRGVQERGEPTKAKEERHFLKPDDDRPPPLSVPSSVPLCLNTCLPGVLDDQRERW